MSRATYGEGSLIEKGPRKFVIRWSEGVDPFTGKHLRRTQTLNDVSKTDARRILRAKTSGRRLTSRMTLGELIDVALPQLDVNDSTRERYDYALRLIPEPARQWRVSDITVTMAGTLIDGLAERHGAASVRKADTALKSCWKQAYRNGWVEMNDNPFRGLKLPKVRKSAGVILTADEVRRLIAVCEPGQEEAWITVSLATGARPGEVRVLRWSDVDLENSVIRFTDEKHDGTIRAVAITDTVADVLASWREHQAEQPVIDDPYLFSVVDDASRPWTSSYAGRDRWHSLRERAGIREGVRLYDLRHTHNSELAAGGVSAATRGKRAGNSAAVNDAIYTHLHPAEDRDAAAVVDAWFR